LNLLKKKSEIKNLASTGRGGGGEKRSTQSTTPSKKDFKKFGHKNALKYEKGDPLHYIFSQPQAPPQTILKTNVHLCLHLCLNNFYPADTFWTILTFLRKKSWSCC
jgi:hypothetical protein